MANIYELSQEYLSIIDELEENSGEITPELEERLSITQSNFKSKIKNYSNLIKSIEADISSIKNEKDRLTALQKSKEASIRRLEKVIINAIELFGDTNKSGNKYIDYGTGKVSVKTTETLDVNQESIDRFANQYLAGLSFYHMQNQLDLNIINPEELLAYGNSTVTDADGEEYSSDFSMEDLNHINADVDIRISLKDLIGTEDGFKLTKALLEYNAIELKASVDKNAIKEEIKETGTLPSFATLVQNKKVTIK